MARVAKSSGPAKPPVPSADSAFIDWFFRPAMLFRVSLIAGLCALWPYAAQRLPSLGKRSEYCLKFQQIRISPAPDRYVPANLLEQVEKISNFSRDLSVLDESLAADVAEAFRKHPWVSKVVRVKKLFPAAIVVELEYRRPAAVVQTSDSRIPVDVNAVVLPVRDFSTDEIGRLPVIQNIRSTPVTQPGVAWNDPVLLTAVQLADFLGAKWNSLKLVAISVVQNDAKSIAADELQLELLGTGGSKILWGRGIGSNYPGELEATQKIRRLENYLTEFGDYHQPNGPYEIDIRHWRENTRRPLVSTQSPAKPGRSHKDDGRIQSSEGKRKTRS